VFQLNEDYRRKIMEAHEASKLLPKEDKLSESELPYQMTIEHLRELQWE